MSDGEREGEISDTSCTVGAVVFASVSSTACVANVVIVSACVPFSPFET